MNKYNRLLTGKMDSEHGEVEESDVYEILLEQVLRKKFGDERVEEFQRQQESDEVNDPFTALNKDGLATALFNDIATFEQHLHESSSIEELRRAAKEKGAEITDQDIEQAKRISAESVMHIPKDRENSIN